jgi:hypothetical protein
MAILKEIMSRREQNETVRKKGRKTKRLFGGEQAKQRTSLLLRDIGVALLLRDGPEDDVHVFERATLRLGDESVDYARLRYTVTMMKDTHRENTPIPRMLMVPNIRKIFE